ncbi:MAG: hypothetical protein V4773_24150 [Verrucomicrobiota bacterium]
MPLNRPLRIGLGIVGALVGLIAVAILSWNLWTIRALNLAKARIAAAGLPTKISDFAKPPVAEAENAAPLIAEIKKITEGKDYDGTEPDTGVRSLLANFKESHAPYKLDDAGIRDLTAILSRPSAREILTLIREAADRPAFDARLDLSLGPKLILEHLAPMRAGVDILRAHIRLASSTGSIDEAFTDLWRLLNLSDFMASEASMMSHLISSSFLHAVIEELAHAVANRAFSERWARRFANRIKGIKLQLRLITTLDVERVGFGAIIFEDMLSGKIDAGEALLGLASDVRQRPRASIYIPQGWVRMEYLTYLNCLQQYRALAASHWARPAEQQRRMRKLTEEALSLRVFAPIILPSLTSIVDRAMNLDLKIAAAVAGLEAYRYRLKHGEYPASLSALVPEFLAVVPRDTFAGADMLYVRKDATFAIYSVGRNGTDDDGKFAPPEHDDLGFFPSLQTPTPAGARR